MGLRSKIITWAFVPAAVILIAVAALTYYGYQWLVPPFSELAPE